jgi:hypothetical protein
MDKGAFFGQNGGIGLVFCPKQGEKTQNLTGKVWWFSYLFVPLQG